jgi:stearoyl-CoA desaturase (delta-9 desaturase)
VSFKQFINCAITDALLLDDEEGTMTDPKFEDFDGVRSIADSVGANAVDGEVRWDAPHSLWNGAMTVTALVFAPLTFSWQALAVFVVSTGLVLLLGHSIGFHRRLIHRSFDCPKWLEHLLVWFGTMVGMSGPFWMIRTHDLRDWGQRQEACHDYLAHRRPMLVDAWWQMHCRLVLKSPPRFQLPTDVEDDRFYRFLERTWMWQQAPVAVALYVLGGWGFVVWGVCARVAISVTGHWFIGHLAHTQGPQTWLVHGAGVQAHDVPWAAIPTMGEAWHNNHHAHPGSARIGLYPGQFDPGYRVIQLLVMIGLAWSVRVPDLAAPRACLRPAEPTTRGAPDSVAVCRLLRVDHSGEHGAVNIYRAQIAVGRWRCPELIGFLRETLAHEREHRERFRGLLAARGERPSLANHLWAAGGSLLGLITGLAGRQAVLICTEAVERTVHAHLLDQITATAVIDPEVSTALKEIVHEEAAHLAFARGHRATARTFGVLLDGLIAAATELLIRLCTGARPGPECHNRCGFSMSR